MKGPLHLQESLTRPGVTDHGRVTALCRALCARYPALRPVTIGRSVLGRQIEALVLTPPDGVTGDRQRVLLAAAFGLSFFANVNVVYLILAAAVIGVIKALALKKRREAQEKC